MIKTTLYLFFPLFSSVALANPTGPSVAAGSATFTSNGATLTITNSSNTIINWQTFSIGSGETTRFNQASASSAVLNRVVTATPSSILGTLTSNGSVFLINPNGVMFGAGSQVSVGALTVSTTELLDGNFLAGNYNFSSGGSANIAIGGTINASGGITINGAGTITVTGILGSTGTIPLTVGTSGGSLGSTGTISLTGGTSGGSGGNVVIAGNVSGSGGVKVAGAGTTTVTGNVSSGGGTVTLAGGTSGGSGGNVVIAGNVSGSGGVTIAGAGTTTVTGNVSSGGGTVTVSGAVTGGSGTAIISGSTVTIGSTTASGALLVAGDTRLSSTTTGSRVSRALFSPTIGTTRLHPAGVPPGTTIGLNLEKREVPF